MFTKQRDTLQMKEYNKDISILQKWFTSLLDTFYIVSVLSSAIMT